MQEQMTMYWLSATINYLWKMSKTYIVQSNVVGKSCEEDLRVAARK